MARDDAVTTPVTLEAVLGQVDTWGAERAAAAVVGPDGVVAARGDDRRAYRWASVTKLVTALATLMAADRGLLDLDEPVGPPGATVRHLLAHASGLPFEGEAILARPERGGSTRTRASMPSGRSPPSAPGSRSMPSSRAGSSSRSG